MRNLITAFAWVAFTCASATADVRPDSHAPISVMGEHLHKQGELMFSYRAMRMSMQGNRDGSSDLSPQQIATTAANPFFGLPMMPPTLRVVPTKMTMDMHMFGVMYAPSDRMTLMGMVNYLDKEMEHTTFMGAVGSNRLGTFRTKTRGLGDTSLAALIKLGDDPRNRWHATIGASLPTGNIDETDNVLTPMNTRQSSRLPYPMQLGSGTYDFIGGITYAGDKERWGWGSQWRSVIRLGENDEHYTLGDEHTLQAWLSYMITDTLSISGRVAYYERDNIDGSDPGIRAPVQTADPRRQGVERVDLGLGANLVLPGQRHRLAIELATPVSQRLDGPQLETDWQVTIGWQFVPSYH